MKQKLDCVLLIDDDEPTNFFSKMLIEEMNCAEHIQVVQSGQDALKYLTQSAHSKNDTFSCPDIIFLDINMPAMNGWEFLDRYNELHTKHKGKMVIVMLTTSLNPDDKLKAYENPAISSFETKPLTTEKLEKILKEYFPSFFLKPTG